MPTARSSASSPWWRWRAVALLLTFVPRLAHSERFATITSEGEHSTSQTTLRFTLTLLFALLLVASNFGLDVVLGAFLAGVVLRRWAPGDVGSLETKLDAVGYGFFIPVFFVSSGMGLDLHSIAQNPLRLLVFFVLLLAVRGLPALVLYKDCSATTTVPDDVPDCHGAAVAGGVVRDRPEHRAHAPANAAALVGAGVLSVMVFPGVAVALNARSAPGTTTATHDDDGM